MTKEMMTVKDLTPAQAAMCKKHAEDIRKLDRGMINATFYIGKVLTDVKNLLGHGHFGAWLMREVGYTQRTAQNYMNVASTLAGKCETVSHLPMTTIYKIAALPDAIRSKIVEMITDPANPPVVEIKNELAKEQEVRRTEKIEGLLAKKAALKTPPARQAAEKKLANELKKREAEKLASAKKAEVLKEQAAGWIERLGPDMAAELVEAMQSDYPGYVAIALRNAAMALAAPIMTISDVTSPKTSPTSVAPDCEDAVIVNMANDELMDLDLSHAA